MNITDYIKPELICLAVALYALGAGLKKSNVRDCLIPSILGLSGAFLAALYVFATSDISTPQNVMLAIFTGITQGVLCAGGSVYVNQLIKQGKKAE